MRAQYEVAARYPTAYYGQLARARLGIDEIALRPPPQSVNVDASEALHAADILYIIGERDLVLHFVADLAEESSDAAHIVGLGELTARYHDARAMLMIGRTALARGLPLDQYAFPDIGVPSYNPIGPNVDRCIVYSIARTESGFDQRDRSSANAVGLMQVTPEAGRDTAKRFGVAYDWDRRVSDPVYNTQMGAAEIAALLKEYRGSYIMTFAGYNAGRGRVQQWVAQHGDPRDPGMVKIHDGRHFLAVRVYYEDTDFTGIVYHANYLRYMERGRTNHLRLIGANHRALLEGTEKGGAGFCLRRALDDARLP